MQAQSDKQYSAGKKICFFFFFFAFAYLFLEGLCSTAYFAYKAAVRSSQNTALHFHTEYDSELGWTNIRNYYRQNFYDTGVYVKINSSGFRASQEFSPQVPPGKLRIICSGDSYTFGTGADNDHTWCQDLTSIDSRLETVNLGVPGYGVDQSYLRYKRDSASLQQDAVIFAIIFDDFYRMWGNTYSGYGKPVLRVRNEVLVTDGVPVAEHPILGWVPRNLDLLEQLRWFKVLSEVARRFSSHTYEPTESQRQITIKMVEDLQALTKQRNCILIFAFLPIESNYRPEPWSAPWRRLLQEEATKRGFVFIDLVDDFRKLAKPEMETLFIPAGSQYYISSAHHYSDYGNEYVAKELYRRLVALPDIAKKLSGSQAVDKSSH